MIGGLELDFGLGGGEGGGWGVVHSYGSREGQFPRWRSAVRVRSEGSAVKAPQ